MKQLALEGVEGRRRKRRPRGAPRLGRPPRPERVGMLPHVARPEHVEGHPVHVSMKRVRLGPNLRAQRVHLAIVEQIARAVKRGIKVVHYSIQEDHLHLMVEGASKQDLARGLKLLFSRIAFAVNRVARRHGSLFRERHHRRALTTPTEVRNALVYILFNARKHALADGSYRAAFFRFLDDKSSAPWFEGWHASFAPYPRIVERGREHWPGEAPIHPPTTWLAAKGWQRAGPLRFDALPRLK
ncbi:MAG: hypothetical protein KIT84_36670 [Labilithrix sp.]|nr:hypothetical protein [Labilithrix sp.]MCW5816590.1 hypothetical protein [Labilithrix sp.]